MAKRHTMNVDDWSSVFGRLEELVMASSGEDPFEEIFKLVIAKLSFEKFKLDGFRIFAGKTSSESASIAARSLLRAEKEWPQILNEDSELKLPEDAIHACLKELATVQISEAHLEALDGLFENLVSRSQKGEKGQFFTPRTVIEAIVRIVKPRPDERVVDPACGSGGFLVHARQFMNSTPTDGNTEADLLFGYDLDPRTAKIAKAMALIGGSSPENIVRLNSLITPSAGESLFDIEPNADVLCIEDVERARDNSDGVFDVILTNPPFAGEVKDSAVLSVYELARNGKRNERDVFFLERCVKLLKPFGRLGIVLPSGRMSTKQNSYIREWLLKNFRVVAVISLERNTFKPHTSQKADVVIGYRRPSPVSLEASKDEQILFLLNDKSGKDSRGIVRLSKANAEQSIWEQMDHDLDSVVEQFSLFVEEQQLEWGKP